LLNRLDQELLHNLINNLHNQAQDHWGEDHCQLMLMLNQ
jgi:hypothetical protein